MDYSELTIPAFSEVLFSKNAVPGGGGASALVGAVGASLAGMVGNLTTGKKKYAQYEADIGRILTKAEELQKKLISLIDADAAAFEPLSKAYGIPKDDPSRAGIMENALKTACSVPLEIMETCCEVIELHSELTEKGSTLAVSDVGVGAACCRAALLGASLNVFINTKAMTNRDYAEALDKKCDEMLGKYTAMADEIYLAVTLKLR